MNLFVLLLFLPFIYCDYPDLSEAFPMGTSCDSGYSLVNTEGYYNWKGTPNKNYEELIGSIVIDSIDTFIFAVGDFYSLKYIKDNLVIYAWKGARIDKIDLTIEFMNLFKIAWKQGLPDVLYIERVTGDPNTMFGIIMTTDEDTAISALSSWMSGEKAGLGDNYKSENNQHICIDDSTDNNDDDLNGYISEITEWGTGEEYVDFHDCANNLDSTFCIYEKTNDFILKNATVAVNTVTMILMDKDNYQDYYEAYTRAYYDSVMAKYEEWLLHTKEDNGQTPFENYYIKADEHTSDITGPDNSYEDDYVNNDKAKRDYNIDRVNATDIFISQHVNEFILIDNNIAPKIVNFNSSRNISFDELTARQRGRNPGMTTIVTGMIINPDKAQEAVDAFNRNSGYSITTDAFVVRTKDKTFNIGSWYFDFVESTILNAQVLYPNVLEHVTTENITNIQHLIGTSNDKMYKDNPIDIYTIIESLLVFSEIGDIAKTTYVEGKKQKEAYNKAKKLEILEIVFGIVGVFTIFLGPEAALIADTAIAAAQLIGEEIIENGDVDPSDLITGLLGMFLPVFGSITKIDKFAELTDLISTDLTKNTKKLGQFKYVKYARELINRGEAVCNI